MENNQLNKPLSILTKELEENLINTINTYTSALHPSVIELIVNKVSMSVQHYADNHARNERTEYEQSLAMQQMVPTMEEIVAEEPEEDKQED